MGRKRGTLMSEPTVSIVIPAYNAGERLTVCLRSIFAQTWRDFEVIVVDDGSTDGAVEKAREAFRAEPRLKVITQTNGGISRARNAGMDAAKGRFLTFVDADDFVHPEWLARVAGALSAAQDCDFALFGFERVGGEATPETAVHALPDVLVRWLDNPAVDFFGEGTQWETPGVCRFLYRREALGGLRFVPGLKEGEDVNFTFRFLRRARRGVWVPLPLYFYVNAAGSVTKKHFGVERVEAFGRTFRDMTFIFSDRPAVLRRMRQTLFPKTTKQFLKTVGRLGKDGAAAREAAGAMLARLFACGLLRLGDFPVRWRWRLLPQWWAGRLGGLHLTQRPRHVFLTFADRRMEKSLRRIGREARAMRAFSEVRVCDERDLSPDFRERFGRWLRPGVRGFGYWVWKPELILRTLEGMDAGGCLLYVDGGCRLLRSGRVRLEAYFEMARQAPTGIVGTRLEGYCDRNWAKGDLLDRLGVRDCPDILDSATLQAGTLIVRKCPEAIAFLRRWAALWAEDFALMDDTPSRSPNDPTFREHRHDQAAFSILAKLDGGVWSVPASECFPNARLRDGAPDWSGMDACFPIWHRRDKAFHYPLRWHLLRWASRLAPMKKTRRRLREAYRAIPPKTLR